MRRFKKIAALALAAVMTLSLAACGNAGTNVSNNSGNVSDAAQYNGKLEFDHSMELTYAKNFSVDYYKGGYKLIKVKDQGSFLVVPEGMSVPGGLDSDTYVLQQPVTKILVSSTPTVSLINAIGALDAVSLTTYDVDTWYIDNVKKQMNDGKLKYVGEYTKPDYELITATGTNFAIFSAMLKDDVKAQLEQLGIKILVDQASYEDHPLARVEWMKLYGAMFNKEAEADKLFAEQEALIKNIETKPATGKTAVIFYITSKGDFYVRNSDDYMAKMISLAGGKYIMDGKVGVGKTGTTKMEAESFFDLAKDADEIIYVWSTGGKPSTLNDLLAKNSVLADMKAVKEGNVWCTTPDFFQISNTIGNIINDMNSVFSADASADKFTYLYKLK